MTTPITQAFQNGYHLEKQGDTFVAAKDRKGCCFSKILPEQTKKEREAVASLAKKFQSSAEHNPSLYLALSKRYRHIDGMISGFINWIKAILFRSRVYNRELKQLRQELQNFRKLFSRKDVINSIKNTIIPPQLFQLKDKNKFFNVLSKELPEAILKKNSTKKDFFKSPFFIKKECDNYLVYFPPFRMHKNPKSYVTTNLEDLSILEAKYHAKKLYFVVKSLPFNKVNNQEVIKFSFSKMTNYLSVEYYLITKGNCKEEINLNTIHSERTLIKQVNSIYQASFESYKIIANELKVLKNNFPSYNFTYSNSENSFVVGIMAISISSLNVKIPRSLKSDANFESLIKEIMNQVITELEYQVPCDILISLKKEWYDYCARGVHAAAKSIIAQGEAYLESLNNQPRLYTALQDLSLLDHR